jgi:hypothetical protein
MSADQAPDAYELRKSGQEHALIWIAVDFSPGQAGAAFGDADASRRRSRPTRRRTNASLPAPLNVLLLGDSYSAGNDARGAKGDRD